MVPWNSPCNVFFISSGSCQLLVGPAPSRVLEHIFFSHKSRRVEEKSKAEGRNRERRKERKEGEDGEERKK